MWLCKLSRSIYHRCHLSVRNVSETLLLKLSHLAAGLRSWSALGPSLSARRTAPIRRGDAVALAGRWDLVPGMKELSPGTGSAPAALRRPSPLRALNFGFLSVQEE